MCAEGGVRTVSGMEHDRQVAVITGASRGLGRALARRLAADGWALVVDARGKSELFTVARELRHSYGTAVAAVAGDVADESHRAAVVVEARRLGGIDLLVHNASVLGPSPQPVLETYPLDVLEHLYAVNVFAPLRLTQLATPMLRPGARVIAITSDAGVEAYEGWGGYGSSKAALEHAFAVWGAERPDLRVYRVDPGDMNTQMHQEAFPGEDISDRPAPESVVPELMTIVTGDLPSGRYQAQQLAAAAVTTA